MKLASTIFAMSALMAASGIATAAPTPAGGGRLVFQGFVNNDACTVDNSKGVNKDFSIDMGSVSIKDMGTDTAPGAGRVEASGVNLTVNCNAGTKVSMLFDAAAGSGVVTGKKALKLSGEVGGAQGVGIVLLDSTGAAIDLSSAANSKIETPLVNGNARLSLGAAYVVVAADPKDVKGGKANAILPFALQYE